MVVKYVAYTWQGERVEGVLEAEREEDAREMLERVSLIPYRLTLVRPGFSLMRLAPYVFRPKPQEIIEFTRGTPALLRSGIPLHQALVILRNETRSLGMKEVLRRVIEDIEAGNRFSDAMARHPSVFSRFYIRLLKFGEATGGVAHAMEQLVQNLVQTKEMKDKVRGALVYPVLSLILAVFVAIILVTFSLPALVGLLEEFGGELPLVTKVLIVASDFIRENRLIMLLVPLGVAGLAWGYFRTRGGARMRDQLLLKAPVVGKVLMQSSLFDMTSTFGTLLEAGIPSAEALQLSAQSLNNRILRERLELIIADVTAGQRMGTAFRERWPSPPLLSQAIITGEASGSLASSLSGLASYYRQESVRAISGATELIQPVVIIVVAGLVGFVATAVMSGIYSALNSIE